MRLPKANWTKRFGPGLLVTAAFVGPGTITTASIAGVQYEFALAWTVVFALCAAMVLQEMAARLGLVTRAGLGEALRASFDHRGVRISIAILVIGAIAVGNAAFEMGNITGAALGLEGISGVSRRYWAAAVGGAAMLVLGLGSYGRLERGLIVMVFLMAMVFVLTALMSRPNVSSLVGGMLTPQVPVGSYVTTIALIGTTVVPYNLFLHASAVSQKWGRDVEVTKALRASRVDTVLSIAIGGIITLAVMVTAASLHGRDGSEGGLSGMATQLRPLLGDYAHAFFAVGLFAAGMTSAITAPLAAAYATSGVMGWKRNLRSRRFRSVWLAVAMAGTIFAMLDYKPIQAIVFAQAINGLLLPVVAVFLLVVVNRRGLMGSHRNGIVANAFGGCVIAMVTGLGMYRLLSKIGVF